MRVFRERDKAARHPVQCFDRAGLDVVDPAVQRETAPFERQRDGRVCLEVGNLGNHVFADHGIDAVPLVGMFPCFIDGLGRIRITQPARHGGHAVQAFAGGYGRHRAAVRVAADHDIGHTKRRHRVFHGGGDATRLGSVAGHDVAGVANHEQIARFSLGEQFGHDATVGAGDEQRPWRLAGGELLEQFPAARQDLALKFQETVDDILHAPLPANSAPLNDAYSRRLRKQYFATVREEVARTVSDPAEIDEEIRALCAALVAAEGWLQP